MNCALVLPVFSLRSFIWRLKLVLFPTFVYLLSASTSKEAKSSCARAQRTKAVYISIYMTCHVRIPRPHHKQAVSHRIPVSCLSLCSVCQQKAPRKITCFINHLRTFLKPKGIYKPNSFPLGTLDHTHNEHANLLKIL